MWRLEKKLLEADGLAQFEAVYVQFKETDTYLQEFPSIWDGEGQVHGVTITSSGVQDRFTREFICTCSLYWNNWWIKGVQWEIDWF